MPIDWLLTDCYRQSINSSLKLQTGKRGLAEMRGGLIITPYHYD